MRVSTHRLQTIAPSPLFGDNCPPNIQQRWKFRHSPCPLIPMTFKKSVIDVQVSKGPSDIDGSSGRIECNAERYSHRCGLSYHTVIITVRSWNFVIGITFQKRTINQFRLNIWHITKNKEKTKSKNETLNTIRPKCKNTLLSLFILNPKCSDTVGN